MPDSITAVILAAGKSRRMGRAKQLLPWGSTTVLGQTVRNVRQSAVDHIVVVTGHKAASVAAEVAGEELDVVYNEDYAEGEMLSSLQKAILTLPADCDGVLVVLADQPMVRADTLNQIVGAFKKGENELVAPSYRGRRGNPVLIGSSYFEELLALPRGDAPRTLLRRHQAALHLIEVNSDTVLQDLDRPQDYKAHRPERRE